MSVWQADGSVWVPDSTAGEVVKLSDTGEVLKRIGGFDGPTSVSVNENDGSCWVGDYSGNHVYRLDANGNKKVTKGGFDEVNGVACYARDGTCWVISGQDHRLVKLDKNGAVKTDLDLGATSGPVSVAVDPRNGDCWVGCIQKLLKVSRAGAILLEIPVSLLMPLAIDCNGNDGSVAVTTTNKISKYDANGNLKWEKEEFTLATGIRFFLVDNTIWVADMQAKKIVGYSASGNKIRTITAGLNNPMTVGFRNHD